MFASIESLVVVGVTVAGLIALGVFLVTRRTSGGRTTRQGDTVPGSRSAPSATPACKCQPGEQCPSAGSQCEPGSLPEGCIETKILYIHNDPKGFRALAKELRRYCVDVTGVNDADTAYLACFSEKPKMILVDSELPGADAEQVIKRIRQHPLAADTHTMVVTEHESHEALHEQRTLNGKRSLAKPIDVEQLLAELTRHTTLCHLAPDCAGLSARYGVTLDWDGADGTSVFEPDADSFVPAERPDLLKNVDSEEAFLSRRRPKVLCIDDDPHVSQAIMTRLRPLGVDVIRAFDGMQGFWTGLDTKPDVIITDMRMPNGEGNYIFSRFRSHPLTKDVPIIVLTGEKNPAVKRTMLSLGVAAYFTKPWNFDELCRELECHIDLCPVGADVACP